MHGLGCEEMITKACHNLKEKYKNYLSCSIRCIFMPKQHQTKDFTV